MTTTPEAVAELCARLNNVHAWQELCHEAAAMLESLSRALAELQENARLIDASISCAAMGHYKRGEPMHDDYKTCGLYDVLDLRDKWLTTTTALAERDAEIARLHAQLEAAQILLNGDRDCYAAWQKEKARAERAEAELAAARKDGERLRQWLDKCTTFYDVGADWPVEGPNIPTLAQVSNRIWYHATDDVTSNPFSAMYDAAIASAPTQTAYQAGRQPGLFDGAEEYEASKAAPTQAREGE